MIYFDNSATTKISPSALETYQKVSEQFFGNPSSLHQLGEHSSRLLHQSRLQIAQLLGVTDEEIYFTSGGTEGDNWAIKGTALEKKPYGNHIITSSVEHPAVRESMEQLEQFGWEVTYLPVNEKGEVSADDVKKAVRPETVLVSIMAVNNEVGSIQPIEEIGEVLREYPSVHFHVDAVQAVGKVPLKLGKDSRIDMAVFSGHKFHAPRGTGFMYIKRGRRLAPLITGGGQESSQRSGTENVPAIAAMAKSFRMTMEPIQTNANKMMEIRSYLMNSLKEKKKVTVFSPEKGAPHIVCFGIKDIRGEVVVHALEDKGIYVSTTSACSSRSQVEASSLIAMNVPKQVAQTAVRVSLSPDNTLEEAEEFMTVFNNVYEQFTYIN
ncbi:cysteine desulfurase family protein [Atopococcus tabaci]|uniref:cysteine desulfurase family protein n=1 Tax=Atopococcus tabaci TaxID=269774 RepID=UPI0003F88883|nr:cysteine desulfurase family protein [Atopococcus tabaci]